MKNGCAFFPDVTIASNIATSRIEHDQVTAIQRMLLVQAISGLQFINDCPVQ